MNSKLDNDSKKSSIIDSNKEPEKFNPLDYNVNIQEELYIQKQVIIGDLNIF